MTDTYHKAMGYTGSTDYVNEFNYTSDLNGLTKAVRDFVTANKHKFFFGGINYCEDCQIIHPRDKCPLCEEYNWYTDDMLHDRIAVIKDNEKYSRQSLEEEMSALQVKINDAVMAHRDTSQRLATAKLEVLRLTEDVKRLKGSKARLIEKIKGLLQKPHLRHIIFDEETI